MQTDPHQNEAARSHRRTPIPIPIAEYLAKPPPIPRPIIRGLLPVGVTTLVDGTGQAGRSLALDMAVAVATGGHVLNRKPVGAGAVLYLFPASHRLHLRRQLDHAAQSTPTLTQAALAVAPIREWSDDTGEVIQRWVQHAKNPCLVVIDGLLIDDLHTYATTLNRLARLARRYELAVLVVRYRSLRPDTWARPWVWLASHPTLTGLLCLEPTPKPGKAQLTAVNWHRDREKHWDLERDPATGRYLLAGSTHPSKLSPERQAILNLLGHGKRLTARQIAKQLGQPRENTRRLLHTMKRKGQVMVEQPHGKNVYTRPELA